MKVKNITICSQGIRQFLSYFAVVETESGEFYSYNFEFSDLWTDEADYFDNERSDFNNEIQTPEDTSGLFEKIVDDEELEFWHERG